MCPAIGMRAFDSLLPVEFRSPARFGPVKGAALDAGSSTYYYAQNNRLGSPEQSAAL
jgi:hypothetical protein